MIKNAKKARPTKINFKFLRRYHEAIETISSIPANPAMITVKNNEISFKLSHQIVMKVGIQKILYLLSITHRMLTMDVATFGMTGIHLVGITGVVITGVTFFQVPDRTYLVAMA